MKKIKKVLEKIRKRIDDILYFSIVFGAILLSAGVYIMGSRINPEIGRDLIILGSGLFYISVIIFTFRL
jgi:ABC-type Mn2+/Zn2+ transport system permease subunit